MKRHIALFCALLLLLNTAASFAETSTPQEERAMLIAQLDPCYNTLQPITVLGREQVEGNGVTLHNPDVATDYPHIVLKKTSANIVLRGWAPTDLSLYAANGCVTLEARATGDPAKLSIGFEESISGRSVSYDHAIPQTIHDEWTSISVPLADILTQTDCTLSSARLFLLKGENV